MERLGKFSRIARPGLNWLWFPFENIPGRLSTRVQQLNVKTETKTKDNVTIEIVIAVQFRVIDSIVVDEPMAADGSGQQRAESGTADPAEAQGAWLAVGETVNLLTSPLHHY